MTTTTLLAASAAPYAEAVVSPGRILLTVDLGDGPGVSAVSRCETGVRVARYAAAPLVVSLPEHVTRVVVWRSANGLLDVELQTRPNT